MLEIADFKTKKQMFGQDASMESSGRICTFSLWIRYAGSLLSCICIVFKKLKHNFGTYPLENKIRFFQMRFVAKTTYF